MTTLLEGIDEEGVVPVAGEDDDKTEMSMVFSPENGSDNSAATSKNTAHLDDADYWKKLSVAFQEEIVRKNRMYRLRLYKNCFVGQEAVDLLVHLTHRSREKALSLGNQLMAKELCPFQHVCDPAGHPELEDDFVFYRFTSSSSSSKERLSTTRNNGSTALKLSTAAAKMDSSSLSENGGSVGQTSTSTSLAVMLNATTEEKIRYFEQGIQVQDRKHRLRTYKKCKSAVHVSVNCSTVHTIGITELLSIS